MGKVHPRPPPDDMGKVPPPGVPEVMTACRRRESWKRGVVSS
jgi:hypothetical protein